MRIAMTIGQLALGGAELAAARLADALAERGHIVEILTKPPIASAVRAEAGRARVRNVAPLGQLRGVGKYAFSVALLHELLARPPDVIHVHQLVEYHLVPALVAGWIRRRPVLVKASGGGAAERNSDVLWLSRSRLWGRRLLRFAAERTSLAVGTSQEMTQELVAAGFRRVEHVPNGVARLPPAALSSPLDVLFVGRLHRVKGVDVLLRAWARVESSTTGELFVVGDGAERASLEAMATELGLRRVRFLGEKGRPFELVLNAAFVLPSRAEGLSNALLEAMARGRPVVTTRVGGSADVIADGRTGLLVPPEDPARLAEALQRVLSDLTLARALGQEARRTVEGKYAIDALALRYEGLYQTLLDEERADHRCAGSRA